MALIFMASATLAMNTATQASQRNTGFMASGQALAQFVEDTAGWGHDAAPDGEGIVLSLRSENQQMLLTVCDNGPGVPPNERRRMLERFYRVTGTVGEGTGLGLAIADEIARVHNTQLQVLDGQGGVGLRMHLQLPV